MDEAERKNWVTLLKQELPRVGMASSCSFPHHLVVLMFLPQPPPLNVAAADIGPTQSQADGGDSLAVPVPAKPAG